MKWAVRDSATIRIGPDIPIGAFDGLRQKLWDLGGTEHEQHPPANVFLMLRMLISTQIEFQQSTNWGFLRWPALIARTESNHRLRRLFVDKLGMQPDTFMDMAFVLSATAMGGSFPIARNYFDSLRPGYSDAMDRMLSLLSRDLSSLRSELQTNGRSKVHGRQELYEFPYLKRFPLLKLRNGRTHCWHPLVLARGLEEAVHLRLSELGGQYTEPFSRLFERYVVELSADLGSSLISEEDYWGMVGRDANAVEAIVPLGDCNILIESKMALFGDDVLLTDDDEAIHRKTTAIRDGIRKAWSVSKRLREDKDAFPSCAGADSNYLIIVTSRELYLGTGEKLRSLYPDGRLDYPDAEVASYLPLEHVFITSIEDFERLTGCIGAGDADLQQLLKDAVRANRDSGTSRLFLSDHLTGRVARWRHPMLIGKARSDSAGRIGSAMGGIIDVDDD